MRPPNDGSPAGQGKGSQKTQTNGDGLQVDCNPFNVAAAKALKRELWIVVQAAHIVAGGRRLSEADADRVHEAHQHIIRVLAAAAGRDVMT